MSLPPCAECGGDHPTGLCATRIASRGMSEGKLPTREAEADQRTLGEWLILLRYRWFARGALRAIQRDKKDYTQIKTFLCGHTHAPDRWEFKNGSVYINGGDWCGNTPHRNFCLIDTQGAVHGPFDFPL